MVFFLIIEIIEHFKKKAERLTLLVCVNIHSFPMFEAKVRKRNTKI